MSTEETTTFPWFHLGRHDGAPEAPSTAGPGTEEPPAEDDAQGDDPVGDDTDTDTEADSEADETDEDSTGLGDAGKKALDRMKAERAAAKKEAAAAKKTAAEERRRAADLARKVAEFEDRDKSELERATAKADRSAEQAAKAVARAVLEAIKASAKGDFADPTDATDALMRDPSKYVDADGEIDDTAIEADLADLLERKPHWAVPTPPATEPAVEAKKKPKADPAQGSRGPVPPTDFRTASKDEVAEELRKFGYRQRSA